MTSPSPFPMTTFIMSEFSETVQWRMSEHYHRLASGFRAHPVQISYPDSVEVWLLWILFTVQFLECNVPSLSLSYSSLLLKKNCHPTLRPPVCRSTVNHSSVTAELTRSYPAFTQRAVGMQRVDSFYIKPNKHVMEIRTEISSREVFMSLFLKMGLVAATVWWRPEVPEAAVAGLSAQKQAVICTRIRTAGLQELWLQHCGCKWMMP